MSSPSKTKRETIRTPDSRFENLPDWPYLPHYVDNLEGYEGIRIHYVDEKNTITTGTQEVYLCLHGEPTWSYLYRKMIPVFLSRKRCPVRVIALDWIGFGRSDKFVNMEDYSFDMHRNMLLAFIKKFDLRNITLVVQDWGGVLGLTVPMEMPERFERLLVMNTGFCPGTGKLSQGFLTWREFCKNTTDLDVGKLIAKDVPHLTKSEIAAYNAPFPDVSYKAGVRIFPSLVPDSPQAPGAEYHRRAMSWFREQHMPVFAAIGVRDPVIGRPGMVKTISQFGAGCAIMELEEAGHFVQEWGKEVARRALKSFDLETQKIRKADVTIARKDMKAKL